jgi:hypothetical protein
VRVGWLLGGVVEIGVDEGGCVGIGTCTGTVTGELDGIRTCAGGTTVGTTGIGIGADTGTGTGAVAAGPTGAVVVVVVVAVVVVDGAEGWGVVMGVGDGIGGWELACWPTTEA